MNKTVEFAKSELNKYLFQMTGEYGNITLQAGEDGDIFREYCEISVTKGEGRFLANCPRALLLGVYDFLQKCGCRFLRPGKAGERIPKKELSELTCSYVFQPVNRHRGITIEGAVSVENVLDLIDWSAKVGFNSYFTQFNTSYEFFSRWYEHAFNPLLPKEEMDGERAKAYIKRIVEELKKREMIYHAVGHGWTPACLGIDCNGWFTSEDCLTEEQREFVAQIDGKRAFFKGKPLNTHLCYSNPKVRKALAETVAAYAKTHPEIDVLHFWLADDFNNACECAECAKKRMSDWYVMILNEIDRLLTEAGSKVKIAFLVYLELYWPPLEEKILNKDRFLLMFAPIFRSYTHSYAEEEGWQNRSLMPYTVNKVEYPHTATEYLVFLKKWKEVFDGDSFDFDYHLMWDISRDFGGETLSKVLYEDIRFLPTVGLNGLVSCQIQRAFYPNGLAFYGMGRALTEGISYEELRKEYYAAAFGNYQDFAQEVYKRIEDTVSFAYMKEEESALSALPGFRQAKSYLEDLIENFPKTSAEDGEVERESMEILYFAVNHILRIINVLILKIEGGSEEAIQAADEERKNYFNSRELRFQPYADGYLINMITDGLIACEKTGIYGSSEDRKEI